MIAQFKTKNENWSWCIVFILFASQFLSDVFNLILLVSIFFYYVIKNKYKLCLNLPGRNIYFYFIISGILIGGVNIILKEYSIYIFFKHTYYVLLPFFYWTVGDMLSKSSKNTRTRIIRSLLIASIMYSIYDLSHVIFLLTNNGFISLYNFRNLIGGGSFLAVIGIYLLFFYQNEIGYKKASRIIAYILLLSSLLVHFSRTFLLEVVILIIFSGITINYSKIGKLFAVLIIGLIVIAIIFPDLFYSFLKKIMSSINELNFRTESWSQITVTQNWRGYEVYCALHKFNLAGVIEELFGGGFGATLDVFGYAHLVTDEDSLIFLHNGYFTQLMIWGMVGIILFFLWTVQIYKRGKVLVNKQDRCLVKGMTMVILCITCFIMGPFFGKAVAVYLFYISLFCGLSQGTDIISKQDENKL